VIKIDLHLHTGEDPEDGLRYPATAIVDRAIALGFAAIAVTLHDRVLEDERVFDYARERSLLLIRSVELRIEGCDVLLYNVTQREMQGIRSFDDLRQFKHQRNDDLLVVAPHPFYPVHHSLGRKLEQHIDLFDAIEYSSIHLPVYNPSRRAQKVAEKHHKPIIANSDAHNLWMFGRHYTLVDSEPTIPGIFQAVRQNLVQWISPHSSLGDCLRMFVTEPLFLRKPGRTVESFS
jgi:predicted metal-dependent phosphoesterase TrpH